jgi:hypothetical protein
MGVMPPRFQADIRGAAHQVQVLGSDQLMTCCAEKPLVSTD